MLVKMASAQVHSYGCVMLVTEKNSTIDKMLDQIKESELYIDGDDYGKQKPHVTALYGIKEKNVSGQLPKLIEKAGLDSISVTNVSCFYADDYDVVKLEVEPKGCILRFHDILEKKFPDYKNTHGTYKPHLTLAYVKKGLGDKICKRIKFAPLALKIVKVDYSRQNGENITYDC